MTDRELAYVIAIAEERNVTHAADRLHLAQPSLTQTLRKIEGELGCELFVRRKYGLDPTEAGMLYLQMAREILERVDRFQEDLSKLKNPFSGRLTLGASWYNTLLFLSDIIPELNLRFPQVELSLVEKGTNDLMNLFSNHELDLFLAHEYPKSFARVRRKLSKETACRRLMDEPFLLVAHRKYDLSGLSSEGCADIRRLGAYPFISFNANQRIRNITDSAFEQAGIVTRKVVMTQSFPGAMSLAERGVGLCVLPAFYVRRNIGDKPDLLSYAIDPRWNAYWSTCVYYRQGEAPDPLIQSVVSILIDAARQLEDR